MVRKTFAASYSRRAWFGVGASAIAGASLLLGPGLIKRVHAQTQPGSPPPKTYPLAASSLVLDVTVVGDALIAVGDRGFILRSTDAGQTWVQVPSPVSTMLTAVAFSSATHGVAVGHDAAILRTTDGGQTWTLKNQEPELESPLLDVWFDSAEHGMAIGAYGLLMETNDAGETWDERRVSDDEPHLYAAARLSDGSLLVVGETGGMFRSVDAGMNWAAVESSPYSGTYFGLLPLKDGAVLAYGLRGNLFRSGDQGQTWTQINTDTTASLLGATQRKDGSVLIVGLAGAVLTSTDGQAFKLHNLKDREALSGVIELADGKLLAYGEKGIRPLNLEALS
jgi:photosystem II stability/assembly factor-like uncharacterized protein